MQPARQAPTASTVSVLVPVSSTVPVTVAVQTSPAGSVMAGVQVIVVSPAMMGELLSSL